MLALPSNGQKGTGFAVSSMHSCAIRVGWPVVPGEEDLALVRSTDREGASVQHGKRKHRIAALGRGRLAVQSLLGLGHREQQRLSRGEVYQFVLQVRRIHGR